MGEHKEERREPGGQAREALLEILRTKSYRRGRVVLASGRESDFFIDCKKAVLTARGHVLVGQLMLAALRELPACDAVAGVALGGCSLASAVSLTSALAGSTVGDAESRPLPALYIRKATKDHGTRQRIEGPFAEGMKVVLLEDVVTTGGSTLRAVEALREGGVEVAGVVVLVDRLEGGAEALSEAALPMVALYTRRDFVNDDDAQEAVERA